jgi:hypothetical protein
VKLARMLLYVLKIVFLEPTEHSYKHQIVVPLEPTNNEIQSISQRGKDCSHVDCVQLQRAAHHACQIFCPVNCWEQTDATSCQYRLHLNSSVAQGQQPLSKEWPRYTPLSVMSKPLQPHQGHYLRTPGLQRPEQPVKQLKLSSTQQSI